MRLIAVFLACLFAVSALNAQLSPELTHLEQTLSSKKDTARVHALNKLGWGYRRIDFGKSIRYSEQSGQLSRKLRYWNGLAYSYKNRGAAYSVSGDFAHAREFLGKALQQFSEQNNHPESGNIHNLSGLMYWETGNYDSAIVSYNKALAEYKRGNDIEGIAIVYSNTGIIYYEMGKLGKSLEQYAKALAIAERRNDVLTLSNVHSNIGLIYNQLGNYRESLEHHKASVSYGASLHDYSGEAKSYTNIGVCYFSMHLPDSSLIYHRKALKMYEKIREKKGIAYSLMNIGSIYFNRHDYTTAERHYLRSLELEREISDKHGETILLISLGKLRVAEENYDAAIRLLGEAYRNAYQLKSLRYQVESSQLLAEIHEQLGHTHEAMSYYKIYTVANDSLLRERSGNKLTALLISFATKGKQQEIHSLKKETKRVNSQKMLIAVAGSLLLLLALALLLLLRRRHRREKWLLEQELTINKSALMAYTQHLIEKNAELARLQEQLEETGREEPLSGTTETAEDQRAEALNQLAGSRIVTDEDWDGFKKLFVRVYPKFMLRMKENYPGITQAELRLAALINLQLSSREIASMLGISAESVKKARQRLRKKLELTPEQELDQFIAEFGT
jgi:tetratricopeptide (TPR) repeat protein